MSNSNPHQPQSISRGNDNSVDLKSLLLDHELGNDISMTLLVGEFTGAEKLTPDQAERVIEVAWAYPRKGKMKAFQEGVKRLIGEVVRNAVVSDEVQLKIAEQLDDKSWGFFEVLDSPKVWEYAQRVGKKKLLHWLARNPNLSDELFDKLWNDKSKSVWYGFAHREGLPPERVEAFFEWEKFTWQFVKAAARENKRADSLALIATKIIEHAQNDVAYHQDKTEFGWYRPGLALLENPHLEHWKRFELARNIFPKKVRLWDEALVAAQSHMDIELRMQSPDHDGGAVVFRPMDGEGVNR